VNALSLSVAKLSQKKTTKRDEQNMQDRHKALILARISSRWLNKYKQQRRMENDVENIVASYTENTRHICLSVWTGTPLVVIRKADILRQAQ
jgi:hypothetical protein